MNLLRSAMQKPKNLVSLLLMNNQDTNIIRKGDVVELKIESLAYGARGIARVDQWVIFVDHAIPGQTVKALIYRKRKGYGEGRILEIVKESPFKAEPVCDHFFLCGGCKLQHLQYSQQIAEKKQQVIDIFRKMAHIPDLKIDSILPAKSIYQYRNKMEFSFSNRRWVITGEPEDSPRDFALGLHIPKRWDKILNIDECHIQQPLGNEILRFVRNYAESHGLKPYDVRTHIGYLRHLVLRHGINTGDVMINIVTSYDNKDFFTPLADALIDEFPQINSLINNVNTRKGDTAHGEFEILYHGNPTIQDRMNDLTFEISSNSFFQTNTLQGEKLYNTVLEAAELTGNETVFDLYCGTGTIALSLAKKSREVHGFEVIVSALEDAARNAVSNGITNCFFHKANLDTFFKDKGNFKNIPKPDVVVVDPPRAGMHEKMTQFIPRLNPAKIIYVSCNPSTQARDTVLLMENGYLLSHITLVDMFPHTAHIETVAVFKKEK